MTKRFASRRAGVLLSFLCLFHTFIVSERAHATTLLAVVAATHAVTRATPTPTPTPTPPPIDIDPIGPTFPAPSGGLFPFPCEYIDLGEDSGGVVTPVCRWLDVGLGGSASDGGDFSVCVCARVDVIGLFGDIFGEGH